jgi:hypothetical protein
MVPPARSTRVGAFVSIIMGVSSGKRDQCSTRNTRATRGAGAGPVRNGSAYHDREVGHICDSKNELKAAPIS